MSRMLLLWLALPWWLFRLTRPEEWQVLDWRYRHGWSRTERPEPVARQWYDRLTPEPTHVCREGRCGCWVSDLTSVRVAASARVEVST